GEEAARQIPGSDQTHWLDRLEQEHDNLRAALEWAACIDPHAGIRLAGALSRFWDIRGHFDEGRQQLSAILGAEEPVQRTAARARALNGAGVLAYSQGDYTAAKATLVESLAVSRELDDRPATARSLSNVALVALAQGDYATARVDLEES